MTAIPKLVFPAVQLDVPPLTPAEFAAAPFVPAGFAAEEYAVASALDEVVPVLSAVPVCCICAYIEAVPAPDKTIAARIAIKKGLSFFAPLMV
jgi:hypothetical protein